MITSRGVSLAVALVVLYLLGMAVHYEEFGVLSIACLSVLIGGLFWVLRAPRLHVERTIEPNRVTRGEVALGLLRVANPGRYSVSSAYAVEQFGSEHLGIDIPRLTPGASTRSTYRLPTDRRAVVEIGPLSVGREDPFRLWRTSLKVGSIERLFVHPLTHALRGIPSGKTRSVDGADSERLPQGGIAFQNLREYVWGDDLRHVHWRSTARLGTLMVRENVDASTPRVTILLDTLADNFVADCFEDAVEAAGSVALALTRAGFPVKLITTGGRSVVGRGLPGDANPILDLLSEIALGPTGSLSEIVPSLFHDRSRDVLVAITGRAREADLVAVAALAGRFDQGIISIVDAEAGQVHCPVSGTTVVLRGESGAGFADAWNRAVAR